MRVAHFHFPERIAINMGRDFETYTQLIRRGRLIIPITFNRSFFHPPNGCDYFMLALMMAVIIMFNRVDFVIWVFMKISFNDYRRHTHIEVDRGFSSK